MLLGIYETAYDLWNQLMDIAMTLFTTSPTTAANGLLYTTAHNFFLAIQSVSVPIAVILFLFAIIKEVNLSPPEQQLNRLAMRTIDFAIVIGIVLNLWTVLGAIMGVTDGITAKFATADYEIEVSDQLKEVMKALEESKPDVEFTAEFVTSFLEYIGNFLLFFLGAVATLIAVLASGISIITSGFQRIIKPLVLLPFSTITVAMGAGEPEEQRVMHSYIKTFIGLCLSGAMMVICVRMGADLSSALISFEFEDLDMTRAILYISVQNAITPMMIAGLVKSVDGLISRFM